MKVFSFSGQYQWLALFSPPPNGRGLGGERPKELLNVGSNLGYRR
ncbi:hypothetical protein CCP3SC1_380004 [Gammaproteobacteria bacterium]